MRGGPSTRKLVGGERVPGGFPCAAQGRGDRGGPHPPVLPGWDLSERPGPRSRLSPGAASPRGAGRCQPGVSGGGRPVRTRSLSLAGGCPWGSPGGGRGGGLPGLVPRGLCLLPYQASPLRAGREAWRPRRALRVTLRLLFPDCSVGVHPRFPSVRNKIGYVSNVCGGFFSSGKQRLLPEDTKLRAG